MAAAPTRRRWRRCAPACWAATKAAGIRFLNACGEDNVIDQLKDGVMICTGGDSPAADKGRAFTKRTDPW